ncbi:MAG: hypothetical protein HQM08_17785 [Candidatus Riflebacteria bacterium]|nr:hypothetical protein [Candidatus Riflebacteria bacterium]
MPKMQLVKPFEMIEVPTDSSHPDESKLLDQGLRELIRDCDMTSQGIELRFESEPSFFNSLGLYGEKHQVVFSRFPENQRKISVLGVHSSRKAFLSGKPANLGYIHHLRIHPNKRGGNLLARGYQAFRQASAANPTECLTTSILTENQIARSLLENPNGRGPLPAYIKICDYLTAIFPINFPMKRWPIKSRMLYPSALTGRMLTQNDCRELYSLFWEFGSENDGFPYFDEDKIAENENIRPGLKISNFFGLWENNKLVAAIGIWDQRQFKQVILRRVPFFLKFILKSIGLFPKNEQIDLAFLDPWIIKPGLEKRLLPALFNFVFFELRKTGYSFSAWGSPINHPACQIVMEKMVYIPYKSSIYQVDWPETPKLEFKRGKNLVFPLGML